MESSKSIELPENLDFLPSDLPDKLRKCVEDYNEAPYTMMGCIENKPILEALGRAAGINFELINFLKDNMQYIDENTAKEVVEHFGNIISKDEKRSAGFGRDIIDELWRIMLFENEHLVRYSTVTKNTQSKIQTASAENEFKVAGDIETPESKEPQPVHLELPGNLDFLPKELAYKLKECVEDYNKAPYQMVGCFQNKPILEALGRAAGVKGVKSELINFLKDNMQYIDEKTATEVVEYFGNIISKDEKRSAGFGRDIIDNLYRIVLFEKEHLVRYSTVTKNTQSGISTTPKKYGFSVPGDIGTPESEETQPVIPTTLAESRFMPAGDIVVTKKPSIFEKTIRWLKAKLGIGKKEESLENNPNTENRKVHEDPNAAWRKQQKEVLRISKNLLGQQGKIPEKGTGLWMPNIKFKDKPRRGEKLPGK